MRRPSPTAHAAILLSLACSHAGADYLAYVSMLNQVVMMGTQLFNDATVPQHHKYAAHQIALLYVSLCLWGERSTVSRIPGRRSVWQSALTVTICWAADAPDPLHPPAMFMLLLLLAQQCLNMLQGETKPIRRLIEHHFEDIKIITESKNPYLSIDLANWLQDITWLCHEEVKNCPGYIHRRLEPMLSGIWNAR